MRVSQWAMLWIHSQQTTSWQQKNGPLGPLGTLESPSRGRGAIASISLDLLEFLIFCAFPLSLRIYLLVLFVW